MVSAQPCNLPVNAIARRRGDGTQRDVEHPNRLVVAALRDEYAAQPRAYEPADLVAHEGDAEQETQTLRPEASGYDLRGRRHGGIAGHAQYDDEQKHREHSLRQ